MVCMLNTNQQVVMPIHSTNQKMTSLIGNVPQYCLLTWGLSYMLCTVSTVENNVHDDARRTNM